ncbi:hypothetical protein [Methylobacterium sp. 285MFTsu5.1]|uniref:hypothetical protein n=1 Tax=Methylobacterium sp. 285MFTsu5.1 TaxID=1172187 RepID=UPI00036A0F97|nr:hypothetical protein [Methylobacterium sp. 285MFTsu5.1]
MLIPHLDFIIAYGLFMTAGLILVCVFVPTPRHAYTPGPLRAVTPAPAPAPSWLEPVLIAAAQPEPFFCERTRRWRDPVSRRFVKAPAGYRAG